MTNLIISFSFAVAGVTIIFFNRTLSNKLSAFYSQRFSQTFGTFASKLALDDPNQPIMRFMYRGFVITTGIIFLIFALAAFWGTNFFGPSNGSGSFYNYEN